MKLADYGIKYWGGDRKKCVSYNERSDRCSEWMTEKQRGFHEKVFYQMKHAVKNLPPPRKSTVVVGL